MGQVESNATKETGARRRSMWKIRYTEGREKIEVTL